MEFKHLLTTRDGPVLRLTLNRPDVRNAFNEHVIAELTAWAAQAAAEPIEARPRVVVLAGAGKMFCAGADVTWMAKTVSYTEDENIRDATAMSRMFAALDTLPMPMIGRIQGAALGGGAGLAAVCDIVVASDGAWFGFTETRLGILPAVISPFALAKIGRSAARELFLTGARFCRASQRHRTGPSRRSRGRTRRRGAGIRGRTAERRPRSGLRRQSAHSTNLAARHR